ncbi:MAG: 2-oxoglutarate dehydrogenase E1 component [Myxococcota bacterium]
MEFQSPHNLSFAEELYEKFLADPQSVDPSWRQLFESFSKGNGHANGHGTNGFAAALTLTPTPVVPRVGAAAELQDRVFRLIGAYRARGHKYANLDPLGLKAGAGSGPDLETEAFSDGELDQLVPSGTLPGPAVARVRDMVAQLRETYCRSIGVEFSHIEDNTMRLWLQNRMEATRNRLTLTQEEQLRILTKLTEAESFEQFLHTKFVGAKRFSLEGGESLIPLMDLVVDSAGVSGVREVVIGMAHRGRLNVLVNIMDQEPEHLFAAFDDKHPEAYLGGGDVKYHLGYSTDRKLPNGKSVHLSLCFNPSHLEWVNCVVEGRTRAKQDRFSRGNPQQVLPLIVHGDAAFAGQGLVMETMQLAALPGYATGGTIHVVVNNQVGFTTPPESARSTPQATDIGRMFHIPIFHVNGEDPEAVAHVVKLAVDWRQTFGKDVIIDLFCYRKFGHNEGDEPSFTQPLMYQAISRKKTVREEYMTHLLKLGHVTEQQAEEIRENKRQSLEQALQNARNPGFHQRPISALAGLWSKYKGGKDAETPEVNTAIPEDLCRQLLTSISTPPPDFAVHPKLVKFLEARREMAQGVKPLDWGAAEALTFASLVHQGYPVRLSGQDSRRGTFAHRHAVLTSTVDGNSYTPLQHVRAGQAPFEVYDSPLSEAGVLGFDYGYSLDYPDALIIWEAQFGDFVNAAQVIIDQFLISAETKWNRLSGLTLMLPHGYEGQGPEHSSARVGRFLHLSAQDNIQVANVTTPAQLFHLLRRQVLRLFRKPLVLFTPKSLLRHKSVVSDLAEFSRGRFVRLIGDREENDRAKIRRVLLCSGKVYFDLDQARVERGRDDVAIIRLEQLYPFPLTLLAEELQKYAAGTPLVWVQEEPLNQGAWAFIRGKLPKSITERHPLSHVARAESPSPATGSLAAHKLEQSMLVDEALGTKP